ncbi:MAG: DUF58 domain-containing protein [Polyangiales bacterium]
MTPRASVDELVRDAWPRAQARWSSFLTLREPAVGDALPAVAQIHLGTREVSLDGALIAEHDLGDCIEALLAHEVGHHVRYPATLATQARLQLLERSLIPFEGVSLLNMFTDLLINEHLGAHYKSQYAKAYRALAPTARWAEGPLLAFYLSIYEELWRLEPGAVLGKSAAPFAEAFPGARADAQLLAQDLFSLGHNLYAQYLFFASVCCRYLEPVEKDRCQGPGCAHGDPSPDEWAAAVNPSAQEKEAIARALREGWIDAATADRLGGRDARDRRIAGLPGTGTADARQVPEVMAAWYRLEAERHLITVPTRRVLGDAVVPTSLDEWEPGDPVLGIDWGATFARRGDLYGAGAPLKRDIVSEYEGPETPAWVPRVEVYLDVSGSMPNPVTTLNAMTLAAQIIVAAALRAGGAARALMYSTGVTDYWSWCRSEAEISRFLMHYIGGGTDFPFARLARSVDECGDEQPLRVVITDRDFDANIDAKPQNATVVTEAASRGRALVLLLHAPRPDRVAAYRGLGATVVPVDDLEDFPRMAGALSRGLFGDR